MTYQYRISLSGTVIKEGNYQNLSTYKKMDCVIHKMGKYRHLFPNGGETIKSYTFEENNGQAEGVLINTNARLIDGQEKEFADSLQRQLTKYKTGLQVMSEAMLADVQGHLPEKLYHITDRKAMDTIQKEGLIPKCGNNIYDEKKPFVYLCSRDEVAVWMATLPSLGMPVTIMEIDTAQAGIIEPGRRFTDRDYAMSEFRSEDTIPVQAIHEIDLAVDKVFSRDLISDMEKLLYETKNKECISEIKRGFERLCSTGACTDKEMVSILDEHHNTLDAYTDYLFSTGYYKSLENGDHYIDSSCGVTPMSFKEFHDEMAIFSDSVDSINKLDDVPFK